MANQLQKIAGLVLQEFVKMTKHGFTLWDERDKGDRFHLAPHGHELVRK